MDFLLFLMLTASWGDAQSGSTPTVRCPASISVIETAQSLAGWKPDSATTTHAFERISVYNGTAGAQEYDLAPDEQKKEGNNTVQVWKVAAYRSMNVFLRCRYRDTGAAVSMDLPASITSCRQTIRLDAKGKIAGKPEMVCQ